VRPRFSPHDKARRRALVSFVVRDYQREYVLNVLLTPQPVLGNNFLEPTIEQLEEPPRPL
jgi:hypothetical protein